MLLPQAVRNNNTTEGSYSDDHPAPDMPLAPAPVDRTVSVLKEDYPGYTVEQMARAQSPSGKKDDRSGQANPYSFAWPLVDGPATYSDVVGEYFSFISTKKQQADILPIPNIVFLAINDLLFVLHRRAWNP